MNIKRAVFMAVLVVAVAAMAVPLVSLRASASGSGATGAGATAKAAAAKVAAMNAAGAVEQQQVEPQREERGETQRDPADKIAPETLKALGITRVANPAEVSARIGQKLQGKKKSGGDVSIQSGQPIVLDARSALSAALITTIGGRDNQFSEVTLIADWDGREDCAADREQKVDDFSFAEADIDQSLTRVGISEHTVANGFNENVYYYGDTLGNLWVGTDTNPGVGVGTQIDALRQVNIPALVTTGASGGFTLLNRPAGDCTDDQVTVTGIAVNPVADLADFGLCGTIGEVVYVAVNDAEGCAANAANQVFRTRIIAFAFTDGAGAGAATPAGALQVLRSRFSNLAGVTVDDDGSLYYQLVDIIQFTGGSIFKSTELCRTVAACGAANPRINRVVPSIPDPPTLGSWVGTGANPVVVSGGSRHTNYGGGASTMFGNVVSLASGPCNVLWAAVSASFIAGPVTFEQLTQGLFPAPAAFTAGTPSMIISFADCSGAFDVCSGQATGSVNVNVGGILPVADGFADVAQAGLTRTAGVNNFRIFAQGNGANLAPAAGGTAIVPGTPVGLKKIDMQIDFTGYSGLVVNEQGTVFVISGGTPAGIGKNPSPMLGEVLCFEDGCPADRRADFVDLRDAVLPNPPASGGNVSTTGVSDRFDHIFYQAPFDTLTQTPGGLAGLADGFLRYTNRLAPNAISPGVTLGVVGGQRVQGDDDTTGSGGSTGGGGGGGAPAPIFFEWLDAGHQVAGGDDQNVPNRGDDSDTVPGTTGGGNPNPIPAVPNSSAPGTQRNGGFEYVFGGPVGTVNCVWNGFFLNSNGNITFGAGDPSSFPNVPGFRLGPPKIAPAWADLNPASRDENLCTFPVQAVGFANVNAFKVRWINVPEFGEEDCTTNASNTFSVTLLDDGTGADENTTESLSPTAVIGNNLDDGAAVFDRQEGPTDLRFTREPNTGVLVGCSPRPEGSGIMIFDYCRMDLIGGAGFPDFSPVLVGYSIGGLDPLNPPGLCEIDMSVAAAAAEANPFVGPLAGTNGQSANICANCCIGEGTEPTLFELFNEGLRANTGSGGEITFANADFDLRFEGNDTALCSSPRQRQVNRGRVCLFGVGCTPPANPSCQTVVSTTLGFTPDAGTDLVDALCAVQLNLVGCGFFPNEVTVICQGFETETGVPLQRDGKTVTTSAVLICDTNGDTIPEAIIPLTAVTPLNCNLVRATIPALASRPGTAFPDACCGGPATVVITTTFTAGNNNVFGPFTRTTSCSLNLGTRAPVVFSVTPSDGNCAVPFQDLLISGACFCFTQEAGATDIIGGVTSVIFKNAANLTNTITIGLNPSASGQLKPLSCQLLDAEVRFTSADAGKRWLVFVVGTGGISRNLITPGPTGCALTGNEQGFQPFFQCNSSTTPNPGPTPDIAVVTGCDVGRQENGTFFLDVTATNAKAGATVTVRGVAPKKIKVVEVAPGTTNPTKLRLIKKFCGNLPGNIVITNPGPNGVPSQPFNCTRTCPTQ